MHVTDHAIERFRERVANLSKAEIVAALNSPAIQAADRFGAPFVKLGTGQRIVIHNHAVITVLPADKYPASLAPGRDVASSRRMGA